MENIPFVQGRNVSDKQLKAAFRFIFLYFIYDSVDSELPESADKTVLLREFLEIRTQLNQTIILNGIKT